MVITSDNLRNTHIIIIYNYTEIISRRTIGTRNNQIIQILISNGNMTFNQIIPCRFTS